VVVLAFIMSLVSPVLGQLRFSGTGGELKLNELLSMILVAGTDPSVQYYCYGLTGDSPRCLEVCNGALAKPCMTPGWICASYTTTGMQGNEPYLCHPPCQSDADCQALVTSSGLTTDCTCQSAGSKYAGLCSSVATAATAYDICRFTKAPL
jgi:hypothetical protein